MDEIDRGGTMARPRQAELRRSVTAAMRVLGKARSGDRESLERPASGNSIEEAVREQLYPKRHDLS